MRDINSVEFSERVNAILLAAEKVRNEDIIVLYGQTGSAKSTTVLSFLGAQIQRMKKGNGSKDVYYTANDDEYKRLQEKYGCVPKIGNATSSETKIPGVYTVDGKIIVDMPGIDDTGGAFEKLLMSIAFIAIMKSARRVVGFIVTLPCDLYCTIKSPKLTELCQNLGTMLKSTSQLDPNTFSFYITRILLHNYDGETPEEQYESAILCLKQAIKDFKPVVEENHDKSLSKGYQLIDEFLDNKKAHLVPMKYNTDQCSFNTDDFRRYFDSDHQFSIQPREFHFPCDDSVSHYFTGYSLQLYLLIESTVQLYSNAQQEISGIENEIKLKEAAIVGLKEKKQTCLNHSRGLQQKLADINGEIERLTTQIERSKAESLANDALLSEAQANYAALQQQCSVTKQVWCLDDITLAPNDRYSNYSFVTINSRHEEIMDLDPLFMIEHLFTKDDFRTYRLSCEISGLAESLDLNTMTVSKRVFNEKRVEFKQKLSDLAASMQQLESKQSALASDQEALEGRCHGLSRERVSLQESIRSSISQQEAVDKSLTKEEGELHKYKCENSVKLGELMTSSQASMQRLKQLHQNFSVITMIIDYSPTLNGDMEKYEQIKGLLNQHFPDAVLPPPVSQVSASLFSSSRIKTDGTEPEDAPDYYDELLSCSSE